MGSRDVPLQGKIFCLDAPSLRRRRRHLRGQHSAKRGRRTSDRRNLRDRLVNINLRRRVWIISNGLYVGEPNVDCKGHVGPFCVHRPYRRSGNLSDAKIRLQTPSPNDYSGTLLQLRRLSRARVIEDEGGLAVIPRTIYDVFEWNSCRGG